MTMTMSMLRVDLSTIWAARSKKPRRVRVLPRVLRRPAQCSISLISQDSGEHRQLSAPSCPLCLCCVIFRYLCIWLGSSLLSPPPPVWSRWGAAPAPSPDITRWSHSSGSGGHTQLQCRAGQCPPHGRSRYPVIFLSLRILNKLCMRTHSTWPQCYIWIAISCACMHLLWEYNNPEKKSHPSKKISRNSSNVIMESPLMSASITISCRSSFDRLIPSLVRTNLISDVEM